MNRDQETKNLFIINYLTQMSKLQEILAWFALKDKIINKVLDKYLIGEHVDNESRRLFDRYNICNLIVNNEELIYDDVTVNRALDLSPNDNWRIILNLIFSNYEQNDPFGNGLDMLKELQRETFQKFRRCSGFQNFQDEVRTDRILRLFEEVYDETHVFGN